MVFALFAFRGFDFDSGLFTDALFFLFPFDAACSANRVGDQKPVRAPNFIGAVCRRGVEIRERSTNVQRCNNSFTWRCILRKYSSRAEATDETLLLLGVSRNGFVVDDPDVRLAPEDIVAAFGA